MRTNHHHGPARALRALGLAASLALLPVLAACAAQRTYDGTPRSRDQIAWIRYRGEGDGRVTQIDGKPVKVALEWGLGLDKFEVLAGPHTLGFWSPFYTNPAVTGPIVDVNASNSGTTAFRAEAGHTYQFAVDALSNTVTVKDLR